MTTSVKIGEAAKDRLEELQAEIKLETGRTVTQQEQLDRIVAREFNSKEALVDSFRDDWEGLSEAEIDRVIYEEGVLREFEDDSWRFFSIRRCPTLTRIGVPAATRWRVWR